MSIEKISEIYPGLLFAVKSSASDAYNEGLDRLTDLDYLVDFMTKNASYLDNDVWKAAGFSSTDPYKAAEYVLKEAYDIDDAIITRCENVDAGKSPDLDSMFYYLDGQYKDMVELTPMKAYGGNSPAFIRLYALKIDRNCYLVIHMGIKLAKRIPCRWKWREKIRKRN